MRAARQHQELLRAGRRAGAQLGTQFLPSRAVGCSRQDRGQGDGITSCTLAVSLPPPRAIPTLRFDLQQPPSAAPLAGQAEEMSWVVQERLLLAQSGVHSMGATSEPRPEQTRLSKGSGDDDSVAPGSHRDLWEGAAPKPPPHVPLIITPSPLGAPVLLSPIHNSA